VLTITADAIDAIRAVMGSKPGGIRISAAQQSMNGESPGLMVQPAPAPAEEDAVVETGGTQLYLDSTAMGMLDGKVLDAEQDGDALRFSVLQPE
jgi:Fe-S cluster assembly iron-binding protein IscA